MKSFVGIVSSKASDKTIVVAVNTSKVHPLYRKQYTASKKFMAHDEKNQAQEGDRVSIVETKPLSKRKRFMLIQVIEKASVKHVEAPPMLTADEPADKSDTQATPAEKQE